jgi:hypothetical protein
MYNLGAFIIIVAGAYLLTRMKKIDLLSVVRNREVRKGGPKGWYGWRRKSMNWTSLSTQGYTNEDGAYGYHSDEKSTPAQRQLDAFFSPIAKPPLATPQATSTLSKTDPQRQDVVRKALLDNPAPFGISPQDSKPLPPDYYTYDSNYNNTYNTNTTYVTQNTADVYDPAQREVNHLSYLSSLSSGFGDAQIIIPESGPTKPNAQEPRQSLHQSRKFSWVSSVPGFRRQGDRDTVYTTSSEESAPRFRTVNSWVAQQTGRVERRQQSDKEIPAMPEIPLPLQIGVDHRRRVSEDPAFRHHPGDEVALKKGSRVQSAILDRRMGVN